MPDLLSIVWWRKFYSRVGRGFGWGCALVFGVPLVIGFGWNQYGGRSAARPKDQNTVIATVNGEPITEGQFASAIPSRTGSGQQYAKVEGAVMNQLIASAVIRQLAKKYNVRVNDADVDRKVAEEREQRVGKDATDAQWEEFVAQVHGGMSPSEYRDSLAQDPEMLGKALLDKFKSMELVTPEDVKKHNAEVQVRMVQIGYGRQPFADPKKKVTILTESEAKKKAEDLLAKARAGADLAALAKANSTDFTKDRGGDLGFMPEYRKSPNPMGSGPSQEMLASSYGQEFADAVHATPTGQFTGVVKTSTFGSKGYAFAKVEARRDAPAAKPDPKNPNAAPPVTDPKKVTEELKQERATEKLGNEFKTAFKNANVVFKPEGADAKAYYDYSKVEELQSQAEQARMMAQFGQPSKDPIPTMAEIEQKRSTVNTELEGLLAKHPDDPTLALLVARELKTKMDLAPSDQRAALRERLINLYQIALKGVEDRNIRFDLADLYREKGDVADADAVYQKISHLMDIAPGFDTASLTEEQTARKRLVTGFRSINKMDEAAAEQTKLANIEAKLIEARKRDAAAQKSQNPPGSLIPPGKSATSSMVLPAHKSTPAPKK